MYFDGNKLLTYNSLFNMVVGNRGGGKTYWSKNWSIKGFLKDGSQFVYIRRYDTEFDQGKKEKFFDDIREKYPDHEFTVKGYTAYIDKKEAGFFIPLSKAKIMKSVSFPKVDKVIFDEFILDKGLYHYLKDEVVCFLELYETIARTRDNVRVFFLSNAVTITNPYFLYWGIKPNVNKEIQRVHDDILICMSNDEGFIKEKMRTRFGRLIKGTKYGDYAIQNKFLRDDDTFIGKKSGKSTFYYSLLYNGKKYGVWRDYSVGKYFVSYDTDPSSKLLFTITLDDHTPNTMLLKGRKSRILTDFTEQYKIGNVIFEDMNIKNVCYEIIRLFLM